MREFRIVVVRDVCVVLSVAAPEQCSYFSWSAGKKRARIDANEHTHTHV